MTAGDSFIYQIFNLSKPSFYENTNVMALMLKAVIKGIKKDDRSPHYRASSIMILFRLISKVSFTPEVSSLLISTLHRSDLPIKHLVTILLYISYYQVHHYTISKLVNIYFFHITH